MVQVTKKLYVSAKSRVHAAIHIANGEAVALKAIAKEQLTADEIVKARRLVARLSGSRF